MEHDSDPHILQDSRWNEATQLNTRGFKCPQESEGISVTKTAAALAPKKKKNILKAQVEEDYLKAFFSGNCLRVLIQ